MTTVIATWSDRPHPFQPGTRWPYHAAGLAGRVRQAGVAGRVEDYSHRRGAFAAKARELGLYSVAGALADGLGTALDELREVSHGIHPAILSEAGLGPALKALARRSAVPVELDLNLGPRLAENVEAAAYYIASEALTNVAKHARASVIDMRADGSDGVLTLSIRDDGIGGADPSRGSGIIGLNDRVEALGGTISVLSPPGRGTALHVQLPADPVTVPALPGDTP